MRPGAAAQCLLTVFMRGGMWRGAHRGTWGVGPGTCVLQAVIQNVHGFCSFFCIKDDPHGLLDYSCFPSNCHC